METLSKIILVVVIVLVFNPASAADNGPHGGEIINSEGHTFEVSLDASQSQVKVYHLNAKTKLKANPKKQKPIPQGSVGTPEQPGISLVLFRGDKTSYEVELIPVEPTEKEKALGIYQGSLIPSDSNVVRFELKMTRNSGR
jgi:hypothetical protein